MGLVKNKITQDVYLEIDKQNKVLEKERYRLKVILHTVGIISSVIILITVNLMIYYNDWGLDADLIYVINLFCIFFGFVIGAIAVSKRGKQYSKDYRTNVLSTIISHSFPNVNYKPSKKISKEWCYDSKLFKMLSQLDFVGNDFFSGKIDMTSFEGANLKIKRKSDDHIHPQFQGMFFKFNFNKHFHSTTRIWTKHKPHPANIITENVKFNDVFFIHSDDQVDARFILSTSLMERIYKYYHKSNRQIMVSFIDNNMYLAINLGKDNFEPKFYWPNKTKEVITKTVDCIQIVEEIINDLNLNRRIWGRGDE